MKSKAEKRAGKQGASTGPGSTFEKVRQLLLGMVAGMAAAKQDLMETAKEALAAAEQGLALARGRKEFEVGVVLENILAEQDQTRARQDYARALGEYDKAQYVLSRALGRLGTQVPNEGATSGRVDRAVR